MASAPEPSPEDVLMSLAAALDSDGGMPGESPEARALVTLAALLAFVAHGHTPSTGAFRSHVARMVTFLDSLRGLFAPKRQLVDRVIAASRAGHAPAGNWLELARSSTCFWEDIEQAFAA